MLRSRTEARGALARHRQGRDLALGSRTGVEPEHEPFKVFVQGPNESLDPFYDTTGGVWHGPLVVGRPLTERFGDAQPHLSQPDRAREVTATGTRV
jgi:hypothetical protein